MLTQGKASLGFPSVVLSVFAEIRTRSLLVELFLYRTYEVDIKSVHELKDMGPLSSLYLHQTCTLTGSQADSQTVTVHHCFASHHNIRLQD